MKVLFSYHKNNLLSKVILEVTGQPVSHCAFLYKGTVYHSNFRGVSQMSLEEFESENKIVIALSPTSEEINEYMVEHLINDFNKLKGSYYDIPGLIYLGIQLACKKYLGITLSKKNLWQISGMFVCTEFLSNVIFDTIDSTITPYDLAMKMINSGEWKKDD